jgi:hypothetical protein
MQPCPTVNRRVRLSPPPQRVRQQVGQRRDLALHAAEAEGSNSDFNRGPTHMSMTSEPAWQPALHDDPRQDAEVTTPVAAPTCVRCQRPVVRNRDNYETFERMHWARFTTSSSTASATASRTGPAVTRRARCERSTGSWCRTGSNSGGIATCRCRSGHFDVFVPTPDRSNAAWPGAADSGMSGHCHYERFSPRPDTCMTGHAPEPSSTCLFGSLGWDRCRVRLGGDDEAP